MISQRMVAWDKDMDLYSLSYENFILKEFFNLYSRNSLINKRACWKIAQSQLVLIWF